MKANIGFANGSEITAELNGTCFITDVKPEFPEDLTVVTVTCGDEASELHNVEIIECASVDGRYWFSFRELSPEEKRQRELEDAIQMLTDCLLEMSEAVYA